MKTVYLSIEQKEQVIDYNLYVSLGIVKGLYDSEISYGIEKDSETGNIMLYTATRIGNVTIEDKEEVEIEIKF